MDSIRTIIVDDHEAFRETLREFLGDMPGIEVIGEAGNGERAVELTAELGPDLVIMDIHMPLMDGKQACRKIKDHGPAPFMVLYSMDTSALLRNSIETGADRCVAKDEIFEKLRGLREWVRGGSYVDR